MLEASSIQQNCSTPWYGLPDGYSHCSVIPINQGSLVLKESEWMSTGSETRYVSLRCDPYLTCRTRKPSFVFLITHHPSGEKLLWDLGIRKEFLDDYPHPSLNHFQTHFEKDVSEILQEIGIACTDIDRVIVSRESSCLRYLHFSSYI